MTSSTRHLVAGRFAGLCICFVMYARKLLLDEVFGCRVIFYFDITGGRESCFGSRPNSLLEDVMTQRCRAACGKLVWLAHVVLGCDKVAALALCSSCCHGTNTTHGTGRVPHFSSERKFQGHGNCSWFFFFFFFICEMLTTASS